MHAHDRTVDHLHLTVVRRHNGIHQAVPDARLPPAIETIVNRCVRPIALGQIAPWRTRAQHVEHAVENASIVFRHRPRPAFRQQRLNNAPLEICNTVAHDPSSDVCERESLFESRVQE